jgi:hypothetical protein
MVATGDRISNGLAQQKPGRISEVVLLAGDTTVIRGQIRDIAET